MIQKNYCVYYFGQSKADVEEEHLNNRQRLIDSGLFTPAEDV